LPLPPFGISHQTSQQNLVREPDEIVDVFPAKAAADASVIDRTGRAFVDHLLAEGVIIPSRPASDSEDWSPLIPGEFSAPQLERFDDLRDLLLLDP
jgi:hypothetical protein